MKLKWSCTRKYPPRTNSLAHLQNVGGQRKTVSNLLGRNGNGSLWKNKQLRKSFEAVKV